MWRGCSVKSCCRRSLPCRPMYTALPATLCTAHSLSTRQVGLTNDLWGVLSHLRYADRFSLYGQWESAYDAHPELAMEKVATCARCVRAGSPAHAAGQSTEGHQGLR